MELVENFGIADIGPRHDIAVGDAKWQAPRHQGGPRRNVAYRETMALHDRMTGDKGLIAMADVGFGVQVAARNGDIVARRGQAANVMKGMGLGHEILLGAASCGAWFQSHDVVHPHCRMVASG